jgi:hypothetical protein
MDSTDGEGVPLQIGENPNFEEGEASPPWTGTSEKDPHRTIPRKTRDMNRHNMTKITPKKHMTRKKNKNMKGNTKTQIPEP